MEVGCGYFLGLFLLVYLIGLAIHVVAGFWGLILTIIIAFIILVFKDEQI
jgi:hypothetical protein